MNKKIMLSIILGLVLVSPITLAHEENEDEFHDYMMDDFDSHMGFGTGYSMMGFGMFYGTLILAGLILLIVYLILKSRK